MPTHGVYEGDQPEGAQDARKTPPPREDALVTTHTGDDEPAEQSRRWPAPLPHADTAYRPGEPGDQGPPAAGRRRRRRGGAAGADPGRLADPGAEGSRESLRPEPTRARGPGAGRGVADETPEPAGRQRSLRSLVAVALVVAAVAVWLFAWLVLGAWQGVLALAPLLAIASGIVLLPLLLVARIPARAGRDGRRLRGAAAPRRAARRRSWSTSSRCPPRGCGCSSGTPRTTPDAVAVLEGLTEDQSPDLVVVSQVTLRDLDASAALQTGYPYQATTANPGAADFVAVLLALPDRVAAHRLPSRRRSRPGAARPRRGCHPSHRHPAGRHRPPHAAAARPRSVVRRVAGRAAASAGRGRGRAPGRGGSAAAGDG